MEALRISSPDLLVRFTERRGESRTSMSIEVVLRGVDRWGKAFVEKTRTLNISQAGAKAITKHTVSPGSRLRVEIPHLERTSWGTVAWVGDKSGNQQEIGVAIDETSDFWGVQLTEDPEMPQSTTTTLREPTAGPTGEAEVPTMTPPPTAAPASITTEPKKGMKELATSRQAELENFNKLSNALQNLAQRSIEQSLQDALKELNRQTAEIMKDMQEVIIQQTQDRVRQSVEAALQQVEAAGRDAVKRSQSVWQQRIKAVTDSCQSHLEQSKKK